MTREIGVRYLDLGYLEFRVKRQGEEDGRKGTGCIRQRRYHMLERGTRGQLTGEKKSEQSHSRG